MSHPAEQDLALYATGDLSWFSRLGIKRHLCACTNCAEAVQDYREITADLASSEPHIEDWNNLAAEMKANIRLGLEAGACLPVSAPAPAVTTWFSPRFALAFASLMFLIGAGIVLRPDQPKPTPTVLAAHQQSVQQQSVKVDTEGVTITNVYME